jgi:class 3 adenylate cyclase
LKSAFSKPIAGEHLGVRIGITAGEPLAEDGDLFGASVIAAARIAGLAEAGQMLVTNVVRELLLGRRYQFDAMGQHFLKGLPEPVAVWQAS